MKVILCAIMLLTCGLSFAESTCDVRVGKSIGLKVVEFATGNVVHSKMPLAETSASALQEEFISLQDMGICEEKILNKKCVLKYEKKKNFKGITLYRGQDRWITWHLKAKKKAQLFVKGLVQVGLCS